MDRAVVAAGVDAPGERDQRLAGDVDDGAAGHGALCRARDVEQDRDREVARLVAAGSPDPVGALARGDEVEAGAHRRVEVDLVAVGLLRQHHAAGAQRLEAAADGADAAPGGGVGREGGAGLGLGGEHPAMVGQPGAGLVVPFGVEVVARQPLAVGVGRRKVEVELQPGRRGLGYLAEGDLVEVVGRLAGAVGVVVVDAAVEVEELGPAEDRLELVQDQAVAALGLVRLAAPGAVHPLRALLAAARGRAVLGRGLAAARGRFERGPERHRLERAVPARGGEAGELAPADRRQHRGGRSRRVRAAEQVADDGLDRGLHRRQAEVAAPRKAAWARPASRPRRPGAAASAAPAIASAARIAARSARSGSASAGGAGAWAAQAASHR